jgi:hypothetical protein
MLSIPTIQLSEGIIDKCNSWLASCKQSRESQVTGSTKRETLSFGYDYFKLNHQDKSFKAYT